MIRSLSILIPGRMSSKASAFSIAAIMGADDSTPSSSTPAISPLRKYAFYNYLIQFFKHLFFGIIHLIKQKNTLLAANVYRDHQWRKIVFNQHLKYFCV